MSQLIDTLLTDLRSLIADLGKDGGLISPSVYDTAQRLRFCPPEEGVEPALEWILRQQQPDGGWGNSPSVPHIRDVPTLAAILALHTYGKDKTAQNAVQAGLAFLQKQGEHWQEPLREDLPVGVELILPKMVKEAAMLGLDVPHQQYAALLPVRKRKLDYIARTNSGPATPPVFSWEAWGTTPSPELLDPTGGVGHSPAATAYWLHLAAEQPHLADARVAAHDYLAKAAKATRSDIPGVVPTAWPINRFEQSFALQVILQVELLDHPALQDVIQPQLQDLASAIRPTGFGCSDFFTSDADDSGAAIAALKGAGYKVNFASIKNFKEQDHFSTYHEELQASLSATARGVHAISFFEKDLSFIQQAMIKQQLIDGRWPGDKWNISWLYSTFVVAFALKLSDFKSASALKSAVNALQTRQHQDGGWGINDKSVVTDTFYGALALYTMRDNEGVSTRALQKAYQWLLRNYRRCNFYKDHRWLNKQEFTAYRVDWTFELSAILTLALNEVLL